MRDPEALMVNWAGGKFTKWEPRWTGRFLSGFQQSGHIQMVADGIDITPAYQANTKAGTTWDVVDVTAVPVILTELRRLIFFLLNQISREIWNSGIWMIKSLSHRKKEVQKSQKEVWWAQRDHSLMRLLYRKREQESTFFQEVDTTG